MDIHCNQTLVCVRNKCNLKVKVQLDDTIYHFSQFFASYKNLYLHNLQICIIPALFLTFSFKNILKIVLTYETKAYYFDSIVRVQINFNQ